MSYLAAQLRYDALSDEHPDDDLYELDLKQLQLILQFADCAELRGHQYRKCERRLALINQLVQEKTHE